MAWPKGVNRRSPRGAVEAMAASGLTAELGVARQWRDSLPEGFFPFPGLDPDMNCAGD